MTRFGGVDRGRTTIDRTSRSPAACDLGDAVTAHDELACDRTEVPVVPPECVANPALVETIDVFADRASLRGLALHQPLGERRELLREQLDIVGIRRRSAELDRAESVLDTDPRAVRRTSAHGLAARDVRVVAVPEREVPTHPELAAE